MNSVARTSALSGQLPSRGSALIMSMLTLVERKRKNKETGLPKG